MTYGDCLEKVPEAVMRHNIQLLTGLLEPGEAALFWERHEQKKGRIDHQRAVTGWKTRAEKGGAAGRRSAENSRAVS